MTTVSVFGGTGFLGWRPCGASPARGRLCASRSGIPSARAD
jgi:hypothetical protein